jgi:purine-binding chemotaxis protein CheW
MPEEMPIEDILDDEIERDQYIVFTIGSQLFGLPAIRTLEISQVLETTEVPNAPHYIEGIMNLRGRLASVIDFRKRFGFEPKDHDEDTRIVVVEQESYPVGIIVDSVEEVIRIPDAYVQQLPKESSSPSSEGYLTGVGMIDDKLIILLDVDTILSKDDLEEMTSFSDTISNIQDMSLPEKSENQISDDGQQNADLEMRDKEE